MTTLDADELKSSELKQVFIACQIEYFIQVCRKTVAFFFYKNRRRPADKYFGGNIKPLSQPLSSQKNTPKTPKFSLSKP
jgi:hypothetical protein